MHRMDPGLESPANRQAGRTAGSGRRQLSAAGLVLVIAALLLPPLVFYRDMSLQGHEPLAADTQAAQVFSRWGLEVHESTGEVPDWYPYIFCGMPSYGSFIYTPRSPVNPLAWAHALLRANRGLYYTFLLFLTGVFTFAFLRRQGFSSTASVTGGLFVSLTPYMPGNVSAGHSTKLEALCLLPGFLLALDLLLDRPSLSRVPFLAGVGAALAWTNHPQVAFYGLLAGFLYAMGRVFSERPWDRYRGYVWKLCLLALLALVLAGLMSAEPYLGVMEYTPHSIRGDGGDLPADGISDGGVSWDYATSWSFHPLELISFIFPAWFGLEGELYWGRMPFTHSTHYLGVAALALAVFGLFRLRGPRRWIWAGISLVVIVIGFGRHMPLLYGPMYHIVPFFNRFRVPSMIYGMLPLTLVYLVAGGIDSLLKTLGEWTAGPSTSGTAAAGAGRGRPKPNRESPRGGKKVAGVLPHARLRPALWISLAGIAFLWIVLAVGASLTGSDGFTREADYQRWAPAQIPMLREARVEAFQKGLSHTFLVLAAGVALLLLLSGGVLRGARAVRVTGLLLAVIVVGDICLMGNRFLSVRRIPPVEAIIPLRGGAEYIASQPGPFRFFPASEQLMNSNAFGLLGLESVGGYHAAKLRAFQDLRDEQLILSIPVVRMLNVRYILSPEAIDWDEQALYAAEDGHVYELPDFLPRAWSVATVEGIGGFDGMVRRLEDPDFDPGATALLYGDALHEIRSGSYSPAEVGVVSCGPGRIVLDVASEGEAFVVVSEMAFPPGWKAWINDSPVTPARVNHVLQGLVVPPGRHEIRMEAASPARISGMRISRAAAVLTALLALVSLGSGRIGKGGKGRGKGGPVCTPRGDAG